MEQAVAIPVPLFDLRQFEYAPGGTARTATPDEYNWFSKFYAKMARQASFTLLQYEEGHRKLLAGTEFGAGVMGFYSIASLLDAFRDTPPDDPSRPAMLAAFPVALAFAYASASIHSDYNELFEGAENIYKYIKYLMDENNDLTDEECYQNIKNLFYVVVTYGNFSPFPGFMELINQKEQNRVSATDFIRCSRVLLNDYEFRNIYARMKEIAEDNTGESSTKARADEIFGVFIEFVDNKIFSKDITDSIIKPMKILIENTQKTDPVDYGNFISRVREILDLNQTRFVEEEQAIRILSRTEKTALIIKLGLDYGDHSVTIAQNFVQPINVFKGLPPSLKRSFVFSIFGLAGLTCFGDFRACLAGTMFFSHVVQNRRDANKIDFWVKLSLIVGGLSSLAATWSNFSGLTDAIIGATDADKIWLYNSVTPKGCIVGLVMGGFAGGGYLLGQTSVNIFFSSGSRTHDINPRPLNRKGKILNLLVPFLSQIARAEIYRSEIFEAIDQNLDAYLPRYAKVMLYLLSLMLLLIVVIPEVRGDYESFGRLLARSEYFTLPDSPARQMAKMGLKPEPPAQEPRIIVMRDNSEGEESDDDNRDQSGIPLLERKRPGLE